MSAPYLISRVADPLFAFFIGSSSAVLRIQKDIRESAASASATVTQTQQTQNTIAGGMPQTKVKSPTVDTEDASLSRIFETGSRRVGMWWRGEFNGL